MNLMLAYAGIDLNDIVPGDVYWIALRDGAFGVGVAAFAFRYDKHQPFNHVLYIDGNRIRYMGAIPFPKNDIRDCIPLDVLL